MRMLCGTIAGRLSRGERVVLATVLETSGSVPRATGAAMAVYEDGTVQGTVGGGAAELAATAVARSLLPPERFSTVQTFESMPGSEPSGEQCGGRVTILFHPLGAAEAEVFAQAAALSGGRAGALLVRRLQGDRVTDIALTNAATSGELRRARYTAEPDGSALLTEPIAGAIRVYLFGAGHVAQKLAPELCRVGFSLTVIDAREALLAGEAFSCADERILVDPVEAVQRLTLTETDYAVVMASDHETDFQILEQLLRQAPGYIGCIGSRRKIAMARQRLAAAGITDETFLSRVHAPIGLPIKAETPEEIAVSIAAEMILYRAEQ